MASTRRPFPRRTAVSVDFAALMLSVRALPCSVAEESSSAACLADSRFRLRYSQNQADLLPPQHPRRLRHHLPRLGRAAALLCRDPGVARGRRLAAVRGRDGRGPRDADQPGRGHRHAVRRPARQRAGRGRRPHPGRRRVRARPDHLGAVGGPGQGQGAPRAQPQGAPLARAAGARRHARPPRGGGGAARRRRQDGQEEVPAHAPAEARHGRGRVPDVRQPRGEQGAGGLPHHGAGARVPRFLRAARSARM